MIATGAKTSLLLSIIDLFLFLLVFIIIECLYLNKDFMIGVRAAAGPTFVRVISLQVVVQFLILTVCLYFTKSTYVTYLSLIVTYFSYYSVLRGGLIPLDHLFSFGILGKTTPSFLVFSISSFFTVVLLKQFKLLT